jgi:hypothetical protein
MVPHERDNTISMKTADFMNIRRLFIKKTSKKTKKKKKKNKKNNPYAISPRWKPLNPPPEVITGIWPKPPPKDTN